MKDLQTIIGLFIVLVIILSMGLQFSRKASIETFVSKDNAKPKKNKEKFTTMAHMNIFDDTPAYY